MYSIKQLKREFVKTLFHTLFFQTLGFIYVEKYCKVKI